jgi:F0F1-type ATP synthase assembly protein I
MPEGQPDPKEMGYYFALAHVGLEMVAPMGVGLALDYFFHWTPWATVVGVVVGFVGGTIHLIALANRYDQAKRSKPPGDRPC